MTDVLDPDADVVGPLTTTVRAPRASDTPPWRRRTAIEMVISGALGLFTSFVLSIEALRIAENPDASLSCDINSVISCGTVARTWQANLFGFPNAFLGIAAECVVITIAVAAIGGVTFPRWFMRAAQVVYTLGLIFAFWLFTQSYFVIGALCPWCLLITVTTTLVWAGLTRWNIMDGHIRLPGSAGDSLRRFVAGGNDWFVTVAFLILFAAVVMAKYGYSLFN